MEVKAVFWTSSLLIEITPITLSLILRGMQAMGWSKGVGSRWATWSAKWFSPVWADLPIRPSPTAMLVTGAIVATRTFRARLEK